MAIINMLPHPSGGGITYRRGENPTNDTNAYTKTTTVTINKNTTMVVYVQRGTRDTSYTVRATVKINGTTTDTMDLSGGNAYAVKTYDLTAGNTFTVEMYAQRGSAGAWHFLAAYGDNAFS